MVVAPVLFLLAAVTLRQDSPLRSGCDADAPVIANAKAGDSAQIRFSLAEGASTCYKVSTSAGTGYVHAEQLDGLQQFESSRISAAFITTRIEVESVTRQVALKVDAAGPLPEAMKLIESNQPAAALAMLEPVLKRSGSDTNALTLAGVAAWRADDPRRALEYWKTALELNPDPTVQRLYDKVLRETAGDRSGQKTIGIHINLRYEGETVSPDVARDMLEVLDHEYARISEQLGCRAEERITAIVQSRDAYLKSSGAAEWSGGQYDGRIRISLINGEKNVGPLTRRVFAHELVHACLHSLGTWPPWFHEGLAQKLSGETLSAFQKQRLDELRRARAIPPLSKLNQGWARLSPQQAAAAYAMSLEAVDTLFEKYGAYGLRNILNNPAKFAEVSADITGAP